MANVGEKFTHAIKSIFWITIAKNLLNSIDYYLSKKLIKFTTPTFTVYIITNALVHFILSYRPYDSNSNLGTPYHNSPLFIFASPWLT